MNELCRMSAREAVARLRSREISPLDLIDAALERIGEVEPAVNALPTLCAERARAAAAAIMARPPADPGPGFLYGLPVAIKDTNEVAGVRTTYGSPLFADNVPVRSDFVVETLESNGAVVLAKSNTPEFAAGANTFNDVFGATLNPWDRRMTCGGSSGGSAVALATGEVWLAQGSDFGGSLRIPASFCSVVGLRPSPGRVPRSGTALPVSAMSVQGPLARNVPDLALALDAMCAEHPRDALSLPPPARPFLEAALAPRKPRRIAYSADLGFAPLDPEVRRLCDAAARTFADMGVEVEEAAPRLDDAEEIFRVLRGVTFAATRGPLVAKNRDRIKPEVVWNVEEGLGFTGAQIAEAERAHAQLWHRTASFFERYDALLTAAVVAPPFPVEMRHLAELGGHRFETYVSWLVMSFAITLTHCPAISVPCGFTAAGLPVGLQIVGRPRDDAGVISAAALYEQAAGLAALVPMDPRPTPA